MRDGSTDGDYFGLLASDYSPSTHFRCVAVSDTHGRHDAIFRALERLPAFDFLIHGGDFSTIGRPDEISAYAAHLQALHTRFPGMRSVIVAGNHDILLDGENYESGRHLRQRFHARVAATMTPAEAALRLRKSATLYLENTNGTLDGVHFFGSPDSPEFHDWAFNVARGGELRSRWSKIPTGTNVLITHGPPLGLGDLCASGQRAGCPDLLAHVKDRIRPQFHVFGHIHEGYGVWDDGVTTYINASSCTLRYQATNPPIMFDIRKDGRRTAMKWSKDSATAIGSATPATTSAASAVGAANASASSKAEKGKL
jgi:Icc-related predicted phosphoesterase